MNFLVVRVIKMLTDNEVDDNGESVKNDTV